jgi:integrase/recombinase XerD
MTGRATSGKLRSMTSHSYAIDLCIGELARQGLAEASRRKYTEVLYEFADYLEDRHVEPHELALDHCRGFLDLKLKTRPPRKGQRTPLPPVSRSTLALYVTILRRYVGFLAEEEILGEDYSPKLKRPKRPRPEDIAVVTTSGGDVGRMIAACVVPERREQWDELLCVCTVAYLGPRRNATAQLRREDVDLDRGLLRFREKGDKEIVKPIPHALLELYQAAESAGVWLGPRDFLIPNRGPTRVPGVRSNKVVYRIVKDVAKRARVSAHPHALRAAFAVQFDEQHPEQILALQELLGHARLETTKTYLRRKNMAKAMEQVRDLTFGLPSSAAVPPAGFEPALPASTVPEPIRRKLDELQARSRRRARS